MITKIKIMLGETQEPQIGEGYSSFVKDVGSMGNKTLPKLEDHAEIAKLVKKLRGDDDNPKMAVSEHDHGEMCECPNCQEPGIMAKIMKKFYGRHKS